jgi:SAM-dependent methyltransferase
MARSIAATMGGRQTLVDAPDPAWKGSKDLVCAFDVLEHIEDDHAALRTWMDWLKPTGRLCISVPAHRHRWGAGDEWAGHWRRYDRSDLVGLLKSHGLVIEHLECYGFPLANLTEWAGGRAYRRLMRERGGATSMVRATANSGIDRSDYLRLFRWIDSPFGRFALRAALVMQAITNRVNWGSGYLVLARRG